jgi:hypothetical protein
MVRAFNIDNASIGIYHLLASTHLDYNCKTRSVNYLVFSTIFSKRYLVRENCLVHRASYIGNVSFTKYVHIICTYFVVSLST